MDRLWDNTAYLQAAGCKRLGFDTGHSQTPIVPVMLGEAPLAKTFSRRLCSRKASLPWPSAFPRCRRGLARIRVMNTAAHTREDLDAGWRSLRGSAASWA